MVKPGDRFEHSFWGIWEVISFHTETILGDRYNAVCIYSKTKYISPDHWMFEDNGWTYLGNFSKSQNFSNLYELLSE